MSWLLKDQIGIDIGRRTIKAVKLERKNKKVYLDKFFFYDLAQGTPSFPTLTDLDETLKGLVEVNGFNGHSAIACIDDKDASMFDISLPKMPKKELIETIHGEVETRIHATLEETSVAYTTTAKKDKSGDQTLSVKVFCAGLDKVEPLAQLLTSAQLSPECFDIAMLANIEMLGFNGYLDEASYILVIDLGETKTNVALVKDKKLITTKSIPIAFGLVNSRLQENADVNLDYLQADNIKDRFTQKHDEGESEAQTVVDGVYLELFQQLQMSIEFLHHLANDQPISKVIALGGGAQYPFILSTLQVCCGIETIAANPFRNIEIFSKEKSDNEKIGPVAPHMGTAVGLALRSLNGK